MNIVIGGVELGGCNEFGAASGLCAPVSQTLHLAAVLRVIKAHRGAERVTVEEAKSEIEHALVRLQTGFVGLDSSELAWRLERETGFSLEELAAEADQWTPDLAD